jgi:hypothetical protein
MTDERSQQVINSPVQPASDLFRDSRLTQSLNAPTHPRQAWLLPAAGWGTSLLLHGVIAVALLCFTASGLPSASQKHPPQSQIEAAGESLDVEPVVADLKLDPILPAEPPKDSPQPPPEELPQNPAELAGAWAGLPAAASQDSGEKIVAVDADGPGSDRLTQPAVHAAFGAVAQGYRFGDSLADTPSGTGGAPRGSFCGARAKGSRISYVVDYSGSMVIAFDYVRRELKRSINSLSPAESFQMVFFAGGPVRQFPARGLARATGQNRRDAFTFIDTVQLIDVRDTHAAWQAVVNAMRAAFEARTSDGLEPDLIYLLTDGEFDHQQVSRALGQMQAQQKQPARINVIACGNRDGEKFLHNLAGTNKGVYRFVSDEELARARKDLR